MTGVTRVDAIGSLLSLLRMTDDPDTLCLIEQGAALTRAEVWWAADTLARSINDQIAPGSRIGLVGTADSNSVIGILAAWLSGRSIVLLPSDDSPSGERHLLATLAGCGALLHGGCLTTLPEPVRRLDAARETVPDAAIIFTSGTTRLPRGVRLSSHGIAANLAAMLRVAAPWQQSDVLGLVLPVTHSFGLSMALLALARQTPIVMLGDGPPSRRMAQALDDNGATIFACVPYYLRLMTRRGISIGGNYGRQLRTLYLAGGGICDDDLGGVIPDHSGEVYLMYGCTEATARVAVRRIGDGAARNSVGLPLPGSHVEIVSPNGVVQPPGHEGLIRIHSTSLMIGYLGETERQPGTPFLTTDYGFLNENGDLTITGRSEELVNFRGNRVSLPAVEANIMTIRGVIDARLTPASRDEDATCDLAIILTADAAEDAIRREITRLITPRGLVREIRSVDSLPRTRSGKPLRRA